MDIFGDITTLITLAIAVFIFLRLRSVLGKRTGHQPPPVDPGEIRRSNTTSSPADNVVTLPKRAGHDEMETKTDTVSATESAINSIAKSGTKLNKQLKLIAASDPSFDPVAFLEGAKMAYEMIVTAFADGDRKTLRNLLSRDVYEGFAAAISEREARGEQVRSSFVGIDSADLKAAELNDGDAQLTVRFVSQIISATYDREGEVVDGDPEQVAEVTDMWTFARDVRSRDPNWKLVATESDA